MKVLVAFVILYVAGSAICAKISPTEFPPGLHMGAGSSSYQTEGAWNKDGKGVSIWDRMSHSWPMKTIDGSTGDIACDSYHKVKEDIALVKELGLDFYRFSLSWPRILPTGFSNHINPAGIKYYNTLINELLANNIKPVVTLFHWDLPQSIQDLGGFANPDIALWFGEYARVAFDIFGGRVKTWITINEPKQICQFGYDTGTLAPGVSASGVGVYLCARNLLNAHAHVYHLYDKIYRHRQQGRIGIAISCSWYEPATNSSANIKAAERQRQFDFGLYAHPIFHRNGDFPEIVKRIIAERSKMEKFTLSRLPTLSHSEIQFIRGTSDFFGVNHYTTFYAWNKPEDTIGIPSQDRDAGVEMNQDPEWLTGSFRIFKLVPWGARKLFNYIKDNYGNPSIFITENGFPLDELDDYDRICFITETLREVLNAIYFDGVRIEAYSVWSLLDSFEWNSGYTLRYGLIYVDFTHPNRTRIPKLSAYFYKNLLQSRSLQNHLTNCANLYY